MKITKRQLRRIIRESMGASLFAADIEDPIMQAEDMGMSFGEYIQLYIDAASTAGVEIVQNTPDMFTVQGPEEAIVEWGFQVNQMEGGPSFNEAEFREFAMYEV